MVKLIEELEIESEIVMAKIADEGDSNGSKSE